MRQNALTLICEVKKNELESLRLFLKDHQDRLKNQLRLLGTIHYCRWVIIDEAILDGKTVSPQLAFSSNFDGNLDQHLNDLILNLKDSLNQIYSHCVDFDKDNLYKYLQSIRVKEMAFYQGSPGRSVKTIAQEKELRQYLFDIKNAGQWIGQSAISVHRQLQKKVFENENFSWAKQKIETPKVNWFGLIIFGIVALCIAPILIVWAVYIQVFFERKDKPLGLTRNQLSDEHIQKMQLDEDFGFQNQFSQIIEMKKGRSRLITVNVLYLFTRILIKILFVHGKLMGIPTIHFARWVMVNNNRRMLFFSNFDGSWTQYLGDFIDKSGWGLTGIFGNTVNFPRALFLVFKGAYNQQEFLAWSRNSQIATQLWYVDDPSQSIKNINNNTLIRNELSSNLNEKQATLFLSRI
ncbi:MAG TPA: hypothetical protein PLU17_13115 [Chitinophagaceae bacterium]|nr:hypothetical protein [Chitinophagaceae bacterium]